MRLLDSTVLIIMQSILSKIFPPKRILLALDWSHEELATLMHDLIHFGFSGVAFRGLKIML